MPTWRSLKLGRNPVALFEMVTSVPLVRESLARLDTFAPGRTYPLSVICRWLFLMPLCHLRQLEQMADRLLTDEAVKWSVLGDLDSLGPRAQYGVPPSRSYVSKTTSDYLDLLVAHLSDLYDSLVAALLRSDPLLKYALIYDGSLVPTWGNPERSEWEFDDETSRWTKTDNMIPATDPDAWAWSRRIHSASRVPKTGQRRAGEALSYGFGYRLSALIPSRRAIPIAVSLDAPRPGNGERLTCLRMLSDVQEKFGALVEVPPDRLAVFIADAGLSSKEFSASLRRLRYEPVIPTKRTETANILKDKRLVTRAGSGQLELDVRWDGTVLCPRTDWDRKSYEGGRRPLTVLPSDLNDKGQRWRCSMRAVGECARPCSLEPYYKDSDLRSETVYPRVKKFVRDESVEDGFHFPLFPRAGAEAEILLSYRGRVEHDFSYIKNRGCFGGEGEARLPIRGKKRLELRLLATMIPLAVLALVELGVPMPAELLDDWFVESDGSRLSVAS